MKRFATPMLVLALCAAACSSSLPTYVSYNVACASGVCTGSAPAGVDAGLLMANVDGYRVAACAPSGQTFLDGGALNAYWLDSVNNTVFRGQPLDQGPPAAGASCAVWPDFKTGYTASPSNFDYVYFVPSGVTVTGSSSNPMTVYLYPHVSRTN